MHVFNPTTVLNVRYGYNRFDRNSGQQEEARNYDLTTLGFPAGYNSLIPEINRYFPRLDFDGTTMVDVAFGNDFRPITSHTASATLNKSMGAHSLKAGAEMRIYGERSRSTGNDQAGRYQFTNTYTRQNSASGTDYLGLQNYAAFLLGMPSTTSLTRSATYDEYSTTWGFFVQDDWRINDKLTLNLGLRYEFENPMTERDNKSVSNFDYAYAQPIEPTVQAKYAALNDPALKALVPQLSVKGGLLFLDKDTDTLYNDAEELVPATVRVRLPAGPQDHRPRRRRAVRRVPRAAARRRDPRPATPRRPPSGRRSTRTARRSRSGGKTRSSTPRSWSRSATRTGEQTFLGQTITFFNPTRASRSRCAGSSAPSANWRAAGPRKPPTSATTATTSRSSATSTRCRTST